MTAAETILADVEASGGRVELRPGGVRVDPPSLLDDVLRERIRLHGASLVALLLQLGCTSAPDPALAVEDKGDATPRCELRRFADWDRGRLVRFCAEPSHWHEDSIATFDCVEVDLLRAWAARCGVRHLSRSMCAALLTLKADIGGRIDAETIEQLDALP